MNKKGILCIALAALMLLAVLIVINITSEQEAPSISDCYDGSAVTIVVNHALKLPLQDILDTYIQEFNKKYPNITIQHIAKSSNLNKLSDTIVEEMKMGVRPNIVFCKPEHILLYNQAGTVVALNTLINNPQRISCADGTTEVFGLTQEQLADYPSAFYAEGDCYGTGSIYTLPLSKGADVLYYNKTFFDAHNLTVPTTWEEMWAVCEQIKQIDPKSIPLGYDNEEAWLISIAEQLGVSYLDASRDGDARYTFNDPKIKNYLKQLRSYYEKGYFTTYQLFTAYTYNLFKGEPAYGYPIDYCCYMSISSMDGAKYYCADFEVGISALPQIDPTQAKVVSNGAATSNAANMCIIQSDNPQEVYASWLFIEFLSTNTQFQTDFAIATGYLPVLNSAQNSTGYCAYLESADDDENILALANKAALSQISGHFIPDVFVGSSVAREQAKVLLVRCISEVPVSNQTVDQFIDKVFTDAINTCISQAN